MRSLTISLILALGLSTLFVASRAIVARAGFDRAQSGRSTPGDASDLVREEIAGAVERSSDYPTSVERAEGATAFELGAIETTHLDPSSDPDRVSRSIREGARGRDGSLAIDPAQLDEAPVAYAVVGRALDERGRPADAIDITIVCEIDNITIHVPVDSEGSFLLTPTRSGPQLLVAENWMTGEVLRRVIHESTPSVELVFRGSRPFTISGRCHDDQGSGLPGVEITLPGYGDAIAITDDTGSYRIESFGDADRVNVAARSKDHRRATLSVPIEEDELGCYGSQDFELEPVVADASIEGVVIDEFGVPIDAARIEVVGLTTGRFSHATTDGDGAFRVDELVAERCMVRVLPERGLAEINRPITLRAEEHRFVELELSLVDEVMVRGTLVDPDGRPLAGLPIVVRASGRVEVSARLTTDRHGRFETELPAVGQLLVDAVGTPSGTARGPRLERGQSLETVLVLGTGTEELRGRVEDARSSGSEEPLTGVRIALFWEGTGERGTSRRQFTTITDARGEFSLENLPIGRYRAIVQQSEERRISTRLELPLRSVWTVALP